MTRLIEHRLPIPIRKIKTKIDTHSTLLIAQTD